MFEKVNPAHPDKIADRIAGAIVDLAYTKQEDPKVEVKVLINNKDCNIDVQSNIKLNKDEIKPIVYRILGRDYGINVRLNINKQSSTKAKLKCADSGVYLCVPATKEQQKVANINRILYDKYGTVGKCILDDADLIVNIADVPEEDIGRLAYDWENYYRKLKINPTGIWKPSTTGVTNNKSYSDFGESIIGAMHGKDLSKPDVSVGIYAWLKAQTTGEPVAICCAIGDTEIDGKPFTEIVEVARNYINNVGGFEKLAEFGLVA